MESINNIISSLLHSIPEPVTYGPVTINNDDTLITYTDCFEISLLRFLHLVFGENCHINMDNLAKYMDDSDHCNQLFDFFKEHNTYYLTADYYDTKDGFDERTRWCQLLNDSKLFNYKKYNKYEVCASYQNLFTFFINYFPKIKISKEQLTIDYNNITTEKLFQNYLDIMTQIIAHLQFAHNLDVSLKYTVKYEDNTIFMNIVKKIYVNKYPIYEWEIYQYYSIEDKIIGNRVTGHSDLRFKEQLDSEDDIDSE